MCVCVGGEVLFTAIKLPLLLQATVRLNCNIVTAATLQDKVHGTYSPTLQSFMVIVSPSDIEEPLRHGCTGCGDRGWQG